MTEYAVKKVLLVGLGSIGKRHLENLKVLLPNARFAVLRSRSNAETDSSLKTLTSLREAIDFGADMAFICNPSSMHLEVANALVKKKVHLFIEKPLSNSFDGIEDFVANTIRADVKVMVGYNLRFKQSLQVFKKCLEEKSFGRTLTVSSEVGQFLPNWRPDVDYRSTVSAQSALGGGALLELSHEIDYLIWLFGMPLSVSAQVIKVSDMEMDVDDLVLGRMTYNNQNHILPVNIHLDFLQQSPTRICKAICEQGTVVWDAIEGTVEVFSQNGNSLIFQEESDRNFTYMEETKAFLDCVVTGKNVPVSIEDGANVVSVVEAMRKSSNLGRVIDL